MSNFGNALFNDAVFGISASISFPQLYAYNNQHTSVKGIATSPTDGVVKLGGLDANRFDLSLDGQTFTSSINIQYGFNDVWLGVTALNGDSGTLNAQIGIPTEKIKL